MVAFRGGICGCSRGTCMIAPGGACVVALEGAMHGCSQGGHAWLLWGCAWLLRGGGHAWDTTRYGDTINERAVRILLECILVSTCVSSP